MEINDVHVDMVDNHMHPCAVTRKRNNEGSSPSGIIRCFGQRERKKGERALSNNHNVMLGCVIQKKSFSLGGVGLETYLSNIGLKLMPLSVAICYFYCS